MERGFPDAEYAERTRRAQERLAQAGLGALLLTTEADIRYFTGFLTRFWESPTRPWYLIVPLTGKPVAVIPSIGAALMSQTWIDDIRSWDSPDYRDDGTGLLADALCELVTGQAKIGVPSGPGTHLQMPQDEWSRLGGLIGERLLTGDGGVLRALRMIKSDGEIEKIRHAATIAGRAFARVPKALRPGMSQAQAARIFQMLCLEEGADQVSYLALGAGRGGYSDVISPPSEAALAAPEILMLDTGVVRDGYFCDFNRNFSIGAPGDAMSDAHRALISATLAGFNAARPGATAAELHSTMVEALRASGQRAGAGRFGHGLGMQLTEPPSLLPADDTVLQPGMVLTLEPSVQLTDGKLMVHEENIVVREAGAEWLTEIAAPELAVIA